jgi:hypothetical protein
MSDTYLFEETKISIENVLLAESYFRFAGIDRNIEYDCLKICKACKILLENSYSFRELCRKSNNLILQLNIKEGKYLVWEPRARQHTFFHLKNIESALTRFFLTILCMAVVKE